MPPRRKAAATSVAKVKHVKSQDAELESGDDDDDDDDDEDDDDDDDNDDEKISDEESDGFEEQGSSSSEDDDDDDDDGDDDDDEDAEDVVQNAENISRLWSAVGRERQHMIEKAMTGGEMIASQHLHIDDLSSDDEEATGNTVGRIPLHWYDAYDHIGYDVSGSKVIKRGGKDRLDIALNNRDDPNSNRTVYDMYNDREVVLSERDLEIIRRLQAGAFAHPEHNDTPEYVDYYSSEKELMPIYGNDEPKRRFTVSKWEMMRVNKIVQAIKEGKYKTLKERLEEKKGDRNKGPFLIWNDAEDDVLAESKRYKFHLPAPKMPLPGHAESYNPPEEYLMSQEEKKQYDEMDPTERPYNFVPTKYGCLRHVSGYDNFIKERFERCLDLYLCPRKLKKRLNIDPESLVPSLPKPKELKPYPNSLCLQYLGHTKAVRSLSVSTDGQYLATASEDGTVRLWEVDTSLCVCVWKFGRPVSTVAWNPSPSHQLLAAVVDDTVVFITTGTGDADSTEVTDALLSAGIQVAKSGGSVSLDSDAIDDAEMDSDDDGGKKKVKKVGDSVAKWCIPQKEKDNAKNSERQWLGSTVGVRLEIKLNGTVKRIAWHYKGDYLAVLSGSSDSSDVTVHQLSKAKSQSPFNKSPGNVQDICFHPSRPYLFIATQQHVKVFHLVEQKLVKKLISGCKWISSIDVHHSGDHILLGSYDRRVIWFDMDLSSTPYKTLKYHEKAIRHVRYHRRYPLMASASDDGSIHIFHSAVYNDLSRSPLIVPLKILKGHGVIGGLGVLAVEFHPKQPWVFSAGADGVVNLFQDI